MCHSRRNLCVCLPVSSSDCALSKVRLTFIHGTAAPAHSGCVCWMAEDLLLVTQVSSRAHSPSTRRSRHSTPSVSPSSHVTFPSSQRTPVVPPTFLFFAHSVSSSWNATYSLCHSAWRSPTSPLHFISNVSSLITTSPPPSLGR